MSAPRCNTRISDLGVVGDRRTVALIGRRAELVWYCPRRVDAPALFAALLDERRGGCWYLEPAQARPRGRRYESHGAVLVTEVETPEGAVEVRDWMVMDGLPDGLVRELQGAAETRWVLRATPDFAQRTARGVRRDGGWLLPDEGLCLHGSHPIEAHGEALCMRVPAGARGFLCLLNEPAPGLGADRLRDAREASAQQWRALETGLDLSGRDPHIAHCLRALRLLTYAPTGAVAAAATASLPEIVGGGRNYDYRYVWLRDAAMIVDALVRLGTGVESALAFLGFVCRQEPLGDLPLPPFMQVAGGPAPPTRTLDLAGYRGSRPVRVGNEARAQCQFDGYGNVILAAMLVYERVDERVHWPLIARLADYLAAHWRQADHGTWEEHTPRHHTASKVTAACALEQAAPYAPPAQAARWRAAARDIRAYVESCCRTPEGAYAAVAGGRVVDVTAALFPQWGYCHARAPSMRATVRAIERELGEGPLFRRRLFEVDPQGPQEGAFLAGTLWMARYYFMAGDPARGAAVMDAVRCYGSDLGYFPEQADQGGEAMLGNFPQAFVHAAYVGAALARDAASEE